jgi:Protein of unknown function (DUF1822)
MQSAIGLIMFNIKDSFLSLPIANEYRDIAHSFASKQPFLNIAERVQRNTLAVLVMRDYLEMMGISTNLETSDSWNPVVQICANVADLDIEGLGKVECRSLQTEDTSCSVPPEVWGERIGYTFIQIDANLRAATILGFVPQVEIESVEIAILEPIENLCVAIANLQASTSQVSVNANAIANLSNWLQDLFESGWQELETLLDGNQPQYAWRNRDFLSSIPSASNLTEVRRGKLIDLGLQISGCLVSLVITISESTQNETSIRLAIYPMTDIFLPEFLKLVVLDEAGNIFLQAQARSIDNYIQLQFSGNKGEMFSIQVSLVEVFLIENFIV